MIVVYATPRCGATYYSMQLARQAGLEYSGEIFWGGPFSKSINLDVNELYKKYAQIVINGFSDYNNSVVKINTVQLAQVSARGDFSVDLLIKQLNKKADETHFCIRKNIADQVKSMYALFLLTHRNNDATGLHGHHDIAHGEWTKKIHLEHDDEVLDRSKKLVRDNLESMSQIYDSLPASKRKLVIYEDWASPQNRYNRPMTFENQDFNVDYKTEDFFKI